MALLFKLWNFELSLGDRFRERMQSEKCFNPNVGFVFTFCFVFLTGYIAIRKQSTQQRKCNPGAVCIYNLREWKLHGVFLGRWQIPGGISLKC